MAAAGPPIERAVAEELAGLSDEVARHMESGDSCAASEAAAKLREEATAAINDGKVPSVYLEDLSGLVNEIELGVPDCVEPPPPPPTTTREEEGDD